MKPYSWIPPIFFGDTFEKSLSEGPQKSIGNIMYENKKISLIIDKFFPDLYFFSQSDFLFGEKQWKSFVKNVKKLQISKNILFFYFQA